ncbi:MAG: nuclear transport factor 2 family protein [Acidiferrobacterales bacterium]|nr:nuclear transport factor 2 family protein [Acidiferrobacterales bacterium]
MGDLSTTADNNSKDVIVALLDAIGDAFNRNDIDAVMTFFSEDAIFDHAAGPDINGTRFAGKPALRKVFSGLFEQVENVHWETLDSHISGNKAICEYRRTAKLKSGEVQDFLSVDILTFRDGLIVHKDTYYKNRTVS